MKIITRAVYDIETMKLLELDGYDYFGPVDLCGGDKSKMRKLTTEEAQRNQTNSVQDRQTQLDATGKVKNTADQLMSTGAGKMSPWASANYASNLDNIAKTYADQRAMGFRALNQSGFGSSPGALASTINTSNEQAGRAKTDAFRSGLQDTLAQNIQGANMEQGIAGQYQQGAQHGSDASVSDASARMKMGSTFGDIMGGLGQVANIASSVIPGAGLAKVAAKAGGRALSSVYNVKPNYANTGVGNF